MVAGGYYIKSKGDFSFQELDIELFFLFTLLKVFDLIDDGDTEDREITTMLINMVINWTVQGSFRHISMVLHSGSYSGAGFSNVLFMTDGTIEQINSMGGVTRKYFRD